MTPPFEQYRIEAKHDGDNCARAKLEEPADESQVHLLPNSISLGPSIVQALTPLANARSRGPHLLRGTIRELAPVRVSRLYGLEKRHETAVRTSDAARDVRAEHERRNCGGQVEEERHTGMRGTLNFLILIF